MFFYRQLGQVATAPGFLLVREATLDVSPPCCGTSSKAKTSFSLWKAVSAVLCSAFDVKEMLSSWDNWHYCSMQADLFTRICYLQFAATSSSSSLLLFFDLLLWPFKATLRLEIIRFQNIFFTIHWLVTGRTPPLPLTQRTQLAWYRTV